MELLITCCVLNMFGLCYANTFMNSPFLQAHQKNLHSEKFQIAATRLFALKF